MKLLSRTQAQSKLAKDNDELVETNIRLRQYEKEIITRLNTVKEDYEPDKLQKLKEFEQFAKGITAKKAKLLEELKGIEIAIEQKKDLYYALITKQDRLEERIYQANEREEKLNLRETFVSDLEEKWRMKQPNADVYHEEK